MSALMKCLRSGAYIAIGALTFVLGASTNVQGCHGGGGGYSRGGGGYPGQGPNGTGSQNYPSAQLASMGSASVNNPVTALAHDDDLNLTSDQVQRLEKMVSSGKQRASLVLTKVQKKKLAEIVGAVRKPRTKPAQKPSNSDAASHTTAYDPPFVP